MRRLPIVVLGCGSSIGAARLLNTSYPSMADLAEAIRVGVGRSADTLGDAALGEWKKCDALIDGIGLEEALQQAQTQDQSLLALIRRTVASTVGGADRKFGEALLADDCPQIPLAGLLAHLVKSVPRGSPTVHVVTTNYDHVVEYSCDTNAIPCITGFIGCRARAFRPELGWQGVVPLEPRASKRGKLILLPRPHVRLYKPHGSLSWVNTNRGPLDLATATEEHERIIAIPGISKYEICLTVDVLNRHRELANEAMRHAQAALFYGYGFNDKHLETTMRARLASGMPAIVLAHALTANAEATVTGYPNVWALSSSGSGNTILRKKGFETELEGSVWDLEHFLSTVMGV